MGNCQAAEAATVVIVHPGYKVQRIYLSVSARDVMNSNPGHYVAQVLNKSPLPPQSNNRSSSLPPQPAVKQLKLLRPDDILLIGQVYRLITYQDVLKEFAAKKCMKLGKLLMERGVIEISKKKEETANNAPMMASNANISVKNHVSRRLNCGRHQSHGGGRQWKPALKSISEIGN